MYERSSAVTTGEWGSGDDGALNITIMGSFYLTTGVRDLKGVFSSH